MPGTSWTEQSQTADSWDENVPSPGDEVDFLFGAFPLTQNEFASSLAAWAEHSQSADSWTEMSQTATTFTEIEG
jgi:hypothetical protein